KGWHGRSAQLLVQGDEASRLHARSRALEARKAARVFPARVHQRHHGAARAEDTPRPKPERRAHVDAPCRRDLAPRVRRRGLETEMKISKKALSDAVASVSMDGHYWYSARNLYYELVRRDAIPSPKGKPKEELAEFRAALPELPKLVSAAKARV